TLYNCCPTDLCTRPSVIMQVVLITGCSSGLGRELALAALNAGMRVIATARRIDTLSDLASRGAKVLPLDTTASPRDLAQFVELAIGQYGQIHCLINNAGYLQGGALEEIGHAANMAQFDTNFFGVLNLTHALLPHFRSLPPKTCAIVNISSQGAILNLAGAGIYCASKAALDSVTAVWAKELQPWGVRCTAIHVSPFTAPSSLEGLRFSKKAHSSSAASGQQWALART
ncbi:unnamed protein product, partial [Mycena citricolor]